AGEVETDAEGSPEKATMRPTSTVESRPGPRPPTQALARTAVTSSRAMAGAGTDRAAMLTRSASAFARTARPLAGSRERFRMVEGESGKPEISRRPEETTANNGGSSSH